MRTSRAAVMVSALGIAVFQIVGSIGAAHNQPERRGIDALAVALVIIGPLALARRDRWPLVALAVNAAAADIYVARGYPYGPIFVGVVVALFAAVQAGHRRSTWLLAAAGFTGFVVATVVDPRAEGSSTVHLTLVAGWLAVVVAVSELVKVRRSQAAERQRAAQELRQRQIGEQRLQLAQELHDVLAHNISLINVQASVALHLIDEQPEQVRPALANIKEASHHALDELRTALDVLRRGEAAPRQPAPTLADVDALIAGVRASGIDVRLTREGAVVPLPAAVELAGYRIVQESLTNVTRHAHARVVRVGLTYGQGVTIDVIDDGIGSAAAPADDRAQQGNGIIGMRERAAALGGTVDAGPMATGGFRVTAHLPEVRP
jgi:signal transduction histidine kinase